MIKNNLQTILLGGGCFWCTEAIFKSLRGVVKVTSGYAGGDLPNPDYETVASGRSGHAEVVLIKFDPEHISFQDLLEIFFELHDPTSLNRQGYDVGEEYRSIILYTSDEQKTQAEKYITKLEQFKKYSHRIVTQVLPLKKFYTAEEYHQNYYENNKSQSYCQIIISPKLKKLREKFSPKLI